MPLQVRSPTPRETGDAKLEFLGPNGEIALSYRAGDPEMLAQIRAYQKLVSEYAPGWLTRFLFSPSSNRYRLLVFPISSIHWCLLNHDY